MRGDVAAIRAISPKNRDNGSYVPTLTFLDANGVGTGNLSQSVKPGIVVGDARAEWGYLAMNGLFTGSINEVSRSRSARRMVCQSRVSRARVLRTSACDHASGAWTLLSSYRATTLVYSITGLADNAERESTSIGLGRMNVGAGEGDVVDAGFARAVA